MKWSALITIWFISITIYSQNKATNFPYNKAPQLIPDSSNAKIHTVDKASLNKLQIAQNKTDNLPNLTWVGGGIYGVYWIGDTEFGQMVQGVKYSGWIEIKNTGIASSTASAYRICLANAQFVLGNQDYLVPTLAPGDSIKLTFDYTAPVVSEDEISGLYLYWQIDPLGLLQESDKSDNYTYDIRPILLTKPIVVSSWPNGPNYYLWYNDSIHNKSAIVEVAYTTIYQSPGITPPQFFGNNGNSWSTLPTPDWFSGGVYNVGARVVHTGICSFPSEVFSDQCMLKITDTFYNYSYVNNQPFTIEPFHFVSPSEGWSADAVQPLRIQWLGNMNQTLNIRIEYSVDNGSNWNLIIDGIASDGIYDWAVPDVISGNCKIRIYPTAYPNMVRTASGSIPQRYIVSTSSNPVNGGTTTGSRKYNSGSAVTVTATPNTGYTFTNWTENGNIVSTSSSYTFTISGNRTLVANFTAIPQYSVVLSNNPSNGGTTSGGGTYSSGSSVTVTATPNSAFGYTFTNWTENGNIVSTSSSYTFTISGNRTLVANFYVPPLYAVVLSSNPSNGGTTSGSAHYYSGSSVTISATPNSGFNFANWTENGNVISISSSYTFTISGNRTFVANFTITPGLKYAVNLSSSPSEGGTTSGSGTYNSGSSVTVSATANLGYKFDYWTENGSIISSNSSYTFLISGNRNLVASFSATSQYTVILTSDPTDGGITSGGGIYNYLSNVQVTATPNNGYGFSYWSENGNIVSGPSTYSFILFNNRTLVANFYHIQFSVGVSSNPSNGGTTTGGGTYSSGSSVTVTATSNSGYTFTNWTENGNIVSTSSSYTFTISGNKTIVANFALIPPTQYSVNLSSNPTNGGTTTGGGTYNSGSSVTVTATSNSGYTFTNWTENGNIVSTSSSYTFTISGNRTLVANFTAIPPTQYSVSLSSNPTNGGTTTGGGTYNSGSSVTVTATSNSGYTFTNWTENGTVVSTSSSYTFTSNGNRRLVANFTSDFLVTIYTNPELGLGGIPGAGLHPVGSSVTVIAPSVNGYNFTNWTENGNIVSTSSSYTFIINSDRILFANYIAKCSINLSSYPSNGGTTGGGGT
ncbi:MAG: InlB B-repeat-containing protein, partial [Candidatus Doudnabacteria bacterium]